MNSMVFVDATTTDVEDRDSHRGITNKCTGVASWAEYEINVAGRNPVILDVIRLNHAAHESLPAVSVRCAPSSSVRHHSLEIHGLALPGP